MPYWIDSHAHWDAPELEHHAEHERDLARTLGVACCVVPAVDRNGFAKTRAWAHTYDDAYALGIHPLFVAQSPISDLEALQKKIQSTDMNLGMEEVAKAANTAQATGNLKTPQLPNMDTRLVAVGEIGLDRWIPEAKDPALWDKQVEFFTAQLRLAQRLGLPAIVHSRRAVDAILSGLRRSHFTQGGIAHAFNGSLQQAKMLLDLGFKLGFGGAMTYPRALHLQRLIKTLPAEAMVLETDTPDMPPAWLYTPASSRTQGQAQPHNTSKELPRIAQCIAQCKGITLSQLQQQAWENTVQALPRLRALLPNY